MASAAAIRSDVDRSSKLPDITKEDITIDDKFVDDVFTDEVMIEPYKIVDVDCDHVFEKLAIKKHLHFYP